MVWYISLFDIVLFSNFCATYKLPIWLLTYPQTCNIHIFNFTVSLFIYMASEEVSQSSEKKSKELYRGTPRWETVSSIKKKQWQGEGRRKEAEEETEMFIFRFLLSHVWLWIFLSGKIIFGSSTGIISLIKNKMYS